MAVTYDIVESRSKSKQKEIIEVYQDMVFSKLAEKTNSAIAMTENVQAILYNC